MKTRIVAGLSVVGVVSVLGGVGSGAGGASGQSIQSLGDFPGGFPISRANAISADGSTAVGTSSSAVQVFPFRWTDAGGFEAVEPLPGSIDYSILTVSETGRYIAGNNQLLDNLGDRVGYVWSEASGPVSIGALPTGSGRSTINSVAESGLAVGSSAFAFTPTGFDINRAVSWTQEGGLLALPLPEPSDIEFNSLALRVLDDDGIIVRAESGTWVYEPDGSYRELPGADNMTRFNSQATFMIGNINTPFGPRGVYWTPETGERELAVPSYVQAFSALAMSDDGSIVYGTADGLGRVLWINQSDPVTIQDYFAGFGVNLDGWNILGISGISDDGTRFVGDATRDDWESGRSEGFLITIAPCPADTNRDGVVNPDDFGAWIAAYNTGSPRCDQNNDSACTPSDFFAWVANYNTPCE